jgi:WD40 repeat protein
VAYTPDGKSLVIPASDVLSDKPQGKQVLLFYHAVSYELSRELDLRNTNTLANTDALTAKHPEVGPRIYGIALSPDGRILAIGRRSKDGTRAIIILFDIATGRQLTTASHPSIKPERNDPWRADINALVFTPDGKYLLSSTYDTRIWEIDRPAS